MLDCKREVEARVEFIRDLVAKTGSKGIVFGNSGGKDSALVGILCKMACENTVGIMMPCHNKQNFTTDMEDGGEVAKKFNIENRSIDLTSARSEMVGLLGGLTDLSPMALNNIAPRLRMITVYAVAASEGRLVAGTGNASEIYVGYFTKWGDGGHDFNPIADLTATEVFEMLKYLECPSSIVTKAPSASLFEGQTDEKEMGFTYAELDSLIRTGEKGEHYEKIQKMHAGSAHKRKMPAKFRD